MHNRFTVANKEVLRCDVCWSVSQLSDDVRDVCRDFSAETLMHINIKRCLSLNCIITIRPQGERAEGGCSEMLNMFVFRSHTVSCRRFGNDRKCVRKCEAGSVCSPLGNSISLRGRWR